jgi:hypothetical protein
MSTDNGWRTANDPLHTIVAHPLGLPLFSLLDTLDTKTASEIQRFGDSDLGELQHLDYLGEDGKIKLLTELKTAATSRDIIESDLSSSEVTEWFTAESTEGETALTKALYKTFRKSVAMCSGGLKTFSEKAVEDRNTTGRCFLLFRRRGTNEEDSDMASSGSAGSYRPDSTEDEDEEGEDAVEDEDTADSAVAATAAAERDAAVVTVEEAAKEDNDDYDPVALIEFGTGHEIWWSKFNQGVEYLTLEPSVLDDKSVKFGSKASLLIAVTFDDPESESGKRKPSTMDNFRTGVFLCWKRRNQVCLALLWRKETTGMHDLLHVIANIAAVSLSLYKWQAVEFDVDEYEVLSPHCCKVKYKVY